MTQSHQIDFSFLDGGGAAGALMRAHDWSTSPLGDPALWPQSLRTTAGLILNSKFPMFVAWGDELAFLYNDAYAEILGDKHPSALGSPFKQIWSEIWSDVEPIAKRALMGQSEYHENLPLTMYRKGYPEQTWFTFSYSPARDDSGHIAGVYCACTETTEQVLNKRFREAEYDSLKATFHEAPGLIAIVREPSHVFEFANDAYLRLVGQRDLIGKPVAVALPEVAAQGFVDLLDSVFKSGEPYIGSGVSVKLMRNPDSSIEERFVNFIFQPIRDHSGRVAGIFIEGSDVTDHVTANTALRSAQRELELANVRKDEFLAMLAHELRNPLAPIATAAEVLKRGHFDENRVRQTSAVIARQVAHMTDIVDDLLDVSRLTRGLVNISDDVVELTSVVEESVEQVQTSIRQKNLHFSTQLLPGPMFVRGDRTRLVQVFSNILQNAAKYTPERGHVSLHLGRNGEQIEFGVVDDGAGISPELLPNVFDLFTQAERTPDRSQGGLGLGLALVKSIVALHKGSVSARSGGAGRGSEFIVLLPAVEVSETPRKPGVYEEVVESSGALNFLVVDDNIDAAETMTELLETMGHRAAAAFTAHDALALARKSRPQILLLDIGLPDMDGYELVRRMREMPEIAQSTIIALTGYGQPEDRAKALKAGFDQHLVKPVAIEDLVSIVSQRNLNPLNGRALA